MDRSGMAVATLASRPGARAAVPALRDPPLLTMADMGMNHGSGGMDHGGGDMAGMDHSAMGHDTPTQSATADPMAGMDMSGMNMRDTSLLPNSVKVGPGIDMRSEEHTSELQSLLRISYAVLCLKKNKKKQTTIK